MTTTYAYRDYVRRAFEQSPKPRKKRITLSAAEQDAIEWCQQACSKARTPEGDAIAATLRGLMERAGVCGQ